MKVLILLCLLAISSCLKTPEPSSTTSATSSITETSTDSEITDYNKDVEKADITKSPTAAADQIEVTESSKSKRTIDSNLGYGFNDIAGSSSSSRLLRQSDHPSQGKFRNYFPQTPAQQGTPYQHVRYYSNVRSEGNQQQQQQQTETGHRPYNTGLVSAPASQGASSFSSQSTLQHYPAGNNVDSQEPVYFNKPSYQQVSAYRGPHVLSTALLQNPGSGAHVFPSSGSPHPAHIFSGPPQHAPAYFTGHSLANNPFAAATSHGVPNHFLEAGNFHGSPLLYQHPGNGGFSFLQNPSGNFGPQILPVIILRVSNDASGNNAFHNQGGVSPAFLQTGIHGLNLQTLLYPFQQYQTPQQTVFSASDATQTEQPPHLPYQEGSPGEDPKTHYYQPSAPTTVQQSQQKISYVQQKKPLIPTPTPVSPNQSQKLRKNGIVVGETGPQNDSGYSQYKYGYKDKV